MPVPANPSAPLILLVAAETATHQLFGGLLLEAGYRVESVAETEAAGVRCAALLPDLIIFDADTPDPGADTFCHLLRLDVQTRHLPVLLITSNDNGPEIGRALETGLSDVIPRPVQRGPLIHRVRHLLRTHQNMQRLHLCEERLRHAQECARLGFWEWNPTDNRFWLSETVCQLLGLETLSYLDDLDGFLPYLPYTFQTALRRALQDATETCTFLDVELTILPRKGRELQVHCKGEWQAHSGCVAGTLIDITDYRTIESRLIMLKQAVDVLPIGITITDKGGRIVYTNPAEARMHGYTPEEMLDREARLFAPKRLRQKQNPVPLEQANLWQRESVNRRKNGEEFPVQLSSIAVHDERGEVLGLVTACEDISARKESEQRIHQLAYFDNLTGLYNRWMFRDRLQQALSLAERNAREVALLFLDLDRFKLINDTLGHDFGDLLLRAVSERLQNCMRKADTIARLGGDEFVVILTNVEGPEGTGSAAQRILDAFQLPFELEGKTIFAQPSLGIAIYPIDGRNSDDLIKHADTALYHAKTLGGSTFSFFTYEMNRNVVEKTLLENQLRQALDRDEFTLYYQPLIDLESGRASGFEALLRWRHPEKGLLEPSCFLSVLEDSGLIHRLGEWLLQNACRTANSWQTPSHPLSVAVNISPRQFRQPGLVELVENALAKSGLDPSLLVVELTESSIMDEPDRAITLLKRLRSSGIRIAVDDFGTGYSSLSYLKNFPIDILKIDRTFVRDVVHNPEDAGIVEAVVHIAHRLNLQVVAEGIETSAQGDFVRQCGCHLGQGYYYARPQAEEHIVRLLGEARLVPPQKLSHDSLPA